MKSILLTGGAGFIGSHTCLALLEKGYEVYVIDSFINSSPKSLDRVIDTYKRKIYLYGISMSEEEKDLVLDEAKQILDVDDVVASILLVEDLRIQKN